MMNLIDNDHGIVTFLATITFTLIINSGIGLFKFVWNLFQKKGELSEKSITDLTVALQNNTQSVKQLEHRIVEAEKMISELPKLKNDLRRLFIAMKIVSGEKWADIYKIIKEEETNYN
jgi:hypothetical protein